MDDDSNISYEDLAAKLRSEDLHSPHQANIYCPSVLKNQKLWRHKGAPIMGKWAYLSDNFTSQSSRITCCGTLVHRAYLVCSYLRSGKISNWWQLCNLRGRGRQPA